MPFEKGRTKQGGRQKGTQNKSTLMMKEAIRGAFEELGGEEYLIKVGKEDPKTFLNLASKLLPQELIADITHTHSIADLIEGLDEPDETDSD